MAVGDKLVTLDGLKAVYQDVNGNVNDLKSAVENTGLATILESPYMTQGYIDASGKWANRTSGNPRCAIIPVSGGESLAMKAGSTTTQIAALKTFSNPANGDSADYSDASDWNDIVQVSSNNTFSGTLPSDAKYLYVWLGNYSGFARKPKYLTLNGYDVVQNAIDNIQNVNADVQIAISGLSDKMPKDAPVFEGSKNLIPAGAKTVTVQSVPLSYADGVLTMMSGTASGSGGWSNAITDSFTLTPGTYTLSLSYISIKAVAVHLRSGDTDVAVVSNILNPATFTLSESKTCYIGVGVTSGKTYAGEQIKLQLERGGEQYPFVKPSYQSAVDVDARNGDENILSAFDNIECIGDSLTYGAVFTDDSNSSQAYRPYPVVLGKLTGSAVTILATAGYNPTQWWNQYNGDISAKTNALAIIYLGTNGGLTDTLASDAPTDTQPSGWSNTHTANYARIVNAYLAAGYKVLLVKCYATSGDLVTTNSVIQQIADRFGCGIVENEYMDNISYHYTNDKLYANTLHYNALGYAAFASRLIKNVSRMSETYKSNIMPGVQA